MEKISETKHSLKLVTTVISIILIFSTIGFTNGIQTNNITNIFDSSRGTTYISVVPSSQTVGYGETFSIIVHLDPGEPVIGVQIDLSFNATLIHANSVTNANPAVWQFFQPGIINNTSGEIHGAAVAVFGSTVSTPTDCFNITFTSQSTAGTSPLTLHNVIVTDQNASPIYPVITNGEVIVVSTVNLPPVFGTPSPVNGSTGQPLSFTWSIPISDPEGDLFSWSIECSNGQTNSGTSASNGTKSLSLSGLAYLTTYTVWVNATDSGGSGQYTRSWYTFTTKANLPPVFGTPSPVNGSTGQSLSFTWSIPISDPEGDLFSWTIQCSNGQTNSGSGATNGTKSLALSGLAYSTTYTVWVNATDPGGSGLYTRAWYTFTTKANIVPSLGTPNPANGSTNQPISFTWSIPINDPDDLISWTIQCSNGQSSSGNNEPSGTKSLLLSGLSYATTYTVWVNATDGYDWVRGWFTFTTVTNNPPVFGTPSPVNGSTGQPLSFTWSIPISDPEGDLFSWSIECSNGQTNSGTGASNGTKSLLLSGLAYLTTYTVWVNATDPSGSGQYTRSWYTFTTESNEPPQITSPNPVNGSTGVPISTSTLTVYISDPEGDLISWTIQTSPNVGSSSGNGQTNGTKTCTISGLQYSTTYYWFVNATDPSGSGVTTHNWYYFTTETEINDPPSFSNEIPPDESTNVPVSTSILSVYISDPEGDNIDWTIQTIPNVGSSSGTGQPSGTKTCTISGLSYGTTYTWIVSATDPSGSGQWTTETYIFTTETLPIPDLICHGDLTWSDVNQGSTVNGSFTLQNIGDPGSELDWRIESWPDWGVWTFSPNSGENLKPEDGTVTVNVTVVAPKAKTRSIPIENQDEPSYTYK
jgi:hypothetical protein